MPHVIYVPQGRSARLQRISVAHEFEALYTEGFTNCHVVACIGKEKLALIHFDKLTEEKNFSDEVAWVGEPHELIIIYKHQNVLTRAIQQTMKNKFPDKKAVFKEVDPKYDGVFLSFQTQKEASLHSNIQLYLAGEKPKNLLHHPQERSFLTVHKLRQKIGHAQRVKTGRRPDVQFCIFDGLTWAPVKENELKLNASLEESKEVEAFKKEDPAAELCNKFKRMYLPGMIQNEHMEMGVSELATYMEDYLHQYKDEWIVFKNNIYDVVKHPTQLAATSEDIAFKDDIFEMLRKVDLQYTSLMDFIEGYRKTAPETQYKKDFFQEMDGTVIIHQRREEYVVHEKEGEDKKARAKQLAAKAQKHYTIDKDFAAASALYKEAMILTSHSQIRNEKEVATAFHNYGRALQRGGKPGEAVVYLEYSLSLKTKHLNLKATELETASKAVEECKKEIAEAKETSPPQENAQQNLPSSAITSPQ